MKAKHSRRTSVIECLCNQLLTFPSFVVVSVCQDYHFTAAVVGIPSFFFTINLVFIFLETGKTPTTSTHWHNSSQRILWWTQIKPNRILSSFNWQLFREHV